MTMTAAITWDDVLGRKDLVGGEIESTEGGVVYRGPINKIERQDDMIVFTSPWCARSNPDTDEWENWHITSSFINKEIPPQDIGNGRVLFRVPFLGPCMLFPKNDSKLDPIRVKGLPKASERLLALYPAMKFDREVAQKILINKSWPHQAKALSRLPIEATLRDLLAEFRHSSSAEEFLWYYIEAVMGEKDVHQRVY